MFHALAFSRSIQINQLSYVANEPIGQFKRKYQNSIVKVHRQSHDYYFHNQYGLYPTNNERISTSLKNKHVITKRVSFAKPIFSSTALQFQIKPNGNKTKRKRKQIERKQNRRRDVDDISFSNDDCDDTTDTLSNPIATSTTNNNHPRSQHMQQVNSYNNNSTNSKRNNRAPSWLEQATKDILDLSRIPLGQLTSDDIESITGLMANWAKNNKNNSDSQQSQSSAMQVETLLKRVVDDHNFGNNSVKVTTRMYTMAIDAWAKTGGKKAAERAHMIHTNMVEMYKYTGDDNIRPSTISYNAVLNAWSKSACEEACYNAENILEEMLDSYYSTSQRKISPLPLINDIHLIDQIEGKDPSRNDKDVEASDIVKPDVVSFTSVIDTWAKSGHKDGAAKAMALLKRMEMLYKEQGEIGMKPNVYTYSACINAFAKSEDPDAPKQAEALLEDMKMAYLAGDMDVKPNVVNYNSVINAWGRSKARGASHRAAEILKIMENDNVEADALSYSLVVSAWAHSVEPGATFQAEAVLADMENWARDKNMAIDQAFDKKMREYQQQQEHLVESIEIYEPNGKNKRQAPSSLQTIRVHLDVDCYNTVLIALSKRQEPDASDRAIAIIRRMKKLADEGFETVRPNAKSWNSVLNTLSRSNDTNAANRAEDLLCEMHSEGVTPDVFSYAALLHTYQKNTFPGSAQRADDIVRKMEQLYFDEKISAGPDVYHYTIVCACWARSGERIAAERCWEILEHMEKRVKEGHLNCRPNVRTYNAVIDAYSRAHYVDEAEALLLNMIAQYRRGDNRVKPDGFTFNAVINAWTRSRRNDSGSGAERILKLLLEFYKDGNPDVKPDSRSFSHIIDYYAQCHEAGAGKKAECLLNGMAEMYKTRQGDVVPNMFCFNSVIHAYSRSNDPDAGIHAERVLCLLEDLYSNYGIHRLKPNTFIMNAVIHTWSRSNNPMAGERVEEILFHMEEQFRVGKYQMQPNSKSYGLVLATWSKSLDPDKAKRAYTILRRMDDASKDNEHVSKNVFCYNAVINAAAFTEGGIETQKKAFQIATSTLDELIACKDIEASSSSFGTYIKACGKLSSLPRNLVESKLEWAFNECKELGLVNDFILTQMRYSCQQVHYQKLFGKLLLHKTLHERVEMAEIPYWWRRNVEERMHDVQRGEWWRA